MSDDSVFHKLVSKEPSYTQLLCNLLRLDDNFRARILTRLLTSKAAAIPRGGIRSERVIPEYGRPDLVIHWRQICALCEVKTNPKRGLTPHQEPPADGEVILKCYFSYLQSQKESERWFVMLVPEDWEHRSGTERKLEALKTRFPKIDTKIVTWQEVLDVIASSKPAIHNPFVEEFRKLLLDGFGPLTFSEEECHMLNAKELPGAFQTLRKSQMLIEAIEKFEVKKNKKYNIWPEKTEESYGFHYFVKGRNKQALLWFGLWKAAWEKFGAALSIAVCPDDESYDPGVVKAFCRAYKNDAAKEIVEDDYKYFVHPIPDDVLMSKDPVKALQKQLHLLLEKLDASLKP